MRGMGALWVYGLGFWPRQSPFQPVFSHTNQLRVRIDSLEPATSPVWEGDKLLGAIISNPLKKINRTVQLIDSHE